MARTGQPAIRRVASVERAVALLDTLAESGSDLGTNEIARRTGINPSSVSRLLATLTGGGLVAHVPETERYRLGLRLLELGNAARARLSLRDIAQSHLSSLVQNTGETATLSVAGEHEAITVDFVQSEASVQSVARLGRPSVAHATAVGKVFLAYGGKLPEGPLKAFTEHTVTDLAELAEEVAHTADRGWADAIGEREIDLNALAAPIVDDRGELVAILGLQGPAARFGAGPMRDALILLIECAEQISAGVAK